MLSTIPMPLPIYRDEGSALPLFNNNFNNHTQPASSPYRPSISSPLSSSPIRASTPPPLSPRDHNARRETQSSPIPAPTSRPIFNHSKFASRPTRPNPVAQKREAAQESRRKLFLKNVRQRAEDKRWEARGGEQELLKLEWFSLNKDLLQAKNADLDGVVFDSDIEDAARLREEVMRKPSRALETVPEVSASQETDADVDADVDADEMMVDLLEQEQQAELEALMSSISSQQSSMKPPDSAHWSDDEEYDALFMDYLSQEQEDGQHQGPASSGEMDLS